MNNKTIDEYLEIYRKGRAIKDRAAISTPGHAVGYAYMFPREEPNYNPSVLTQTYEIDKFCSDNNLILDNTYIESHNNKVELNTLISNLYRDMKVIVYSIECLSTDTMSLLQFKDSIHLKGSSIHIIDMCIDSDNINSDILITTASAVLTYKRKTLYQ